MAPWSLNSPEDAPSLGKGTVLSVVVLPPPFLLLGSEWEDFTVATLNFVHQTEAWCFVGLILFTVSFFFFHNMKREDLPPQNITVICAYLPRLCPALSSHLASVWTAPVFSSSGLSSLPTALL